MQVILHAVQIDDHTSDCCSPSLCPNHLVDFPKTDVTNIDQQPARTRYLDRLSHYQSIINTIHDAQHTQNHRPRNPRNHSFNSWSRLCVWWRNHDRRTMHPNLHSHDRLSHILHHHHQDSTPTIRLDLNTRRLLRLHRPQSHTTKLCTFHTNRNNNMRLHNSHDRSGCLDWNCHQLHLSTQSLHHDKRGVGTLSYSYSHWH